MAANLNIQREMSLERLFIFKVTSFKQNLVKQFDRFWIFLLTYITKWHPIKELCFIYNVRSYSEELYLIFYKTHTTFTRRISLNGFKLTRKELYIPTIGFY